MSLQTQQSTSSGSNPVKTTRISFPNNSDLNNPIAALKTGDTWELIVNGVSYTYTVTGTSCMLRLISEDQS